MGTGFVHVGFLNAFITMENRLLARLAELEKRQLRMQRYVWILSSALLLALLALGTTPAQRFDIIRAKGIILEDEQGRDRILIGAPIPASKHRVRTDTALVRKYWSSAYPGMEDQFMRWYADYHHGAEGMVVLNAQGFDRVQLGDRLSDPNSGKRQFSIAGLLWNDAQGWELGGAGVNTAANGKARSVIGLDDGQGEAVHLMALEDGTKGLVIGGASGRLLLGMSPRQGAWFKNSAPYTGFRFFDTEGNLRWEQLVDSSQHR